MKTKQNQLEQQILANRREIEQIELDILSNEKLIKFLKNRLKNLKRKESELWKQVDITETGE